MFRHLHCCFNWRFHRPKSVLQSCPMFCSIVMPLSLLFPSLRAICSPLRANMITFAQWNNVNTMCSIRVVVFIIIQPPLKFYLTWLWQKCSQMRSCFKGFFFFTIIILRCIFWCFLSFPGGIQRQATTWNALLHHVSVLQLSCFDSFSSVISVSPRVGSWRGLVPKERWAKWATGWWPHLGI